MSSLEMTRPVGYSAQGSAQALVSATMQGSVGFAAVLDEMLLDDPQRGAASLDDAPSLEALSLEAAPLDDAPLEPALMAAPQLAMPADSLAQASGTGAAAVAAGDGLERLIGVESTRAAALASMPTSEAGAAVDPVAQGAGAPGLTPQSPTPPSSTSPGSTSLSSASSRAGMQDAGAGTAGLHGAAPQSTAASEAPLLNSTAQNAQSQHAPSTTAAVPPGFPGGELRAAASAGGLEAPSAGFTAEAAGGASSIGGSLNAVTSQTESRGVASPGVAGIGVATPATPSLAAQLGGTVLALARRADGVHTVTLSVQPEALGPVTVRAIVEQGGIRIELIASEQGRDALRAVLPELRRDLGALTAGARLELADDGRPGGFAAHSGVGDARADSSAGGNPARDGGGFARGSGERHGGSEASANPRDHVPQGPEPALRTDAASRRPEAHTASTIDVLS